MNPNEQFRDWCDGDSGRIELRLLLVDSHGCSGAGAQDNNVSALAAKPYVASQLAKLDPAHVWRYLRTFGAWTDAELGDHRQNLQRLLWSACCDIREQENAK